MVDFISYRYQLSFTQYLTADVIKSRMQTDIIGPGRKYSSALDCAIKSYHSEGVGSFFRGIGPTLCRAAPVNAMVCPSLQEKKSENRPSWHSKLR